METQSFLCAAAHAIPDSELLAHARIERRKLHAYTPVWTMKLSAKKRLIQPETVCLISVSEKGLSFAPIQKIPGDIAPDIIGYDFVIKGFALEGEKYHIISRFNGFAIASLPSRDYARGIECINKQQFATGVFYIERSLESLAAGAAEISDSAERYYQRYSKLRNLWLSAYELRSYHEADVALQRTLEQAQACYQSLRKDCQS